MRSQRRRDFWPLSRRWQSGYVAKLKVGSAGIHEVRYGGSRFCRVAVGAAAAAAAAAALHIKVGGRDVALLFLRSLEVQLRVVGHDAVRSPRSTTDMLGAAPFFFVGGDMFTTSGTMASRERRVRRAFLFLGAKPEVQQQEKRGGSSCEYLEPAVWPAFRGSLGVRRVIRIGSHTDEAVRARAVREARRIRRSANSSLRGTGGPD